MRIYRRPLAVLLVAAVAWGGWKLYSDMGEADLLAMLRAMDRNNEQIQDANQAIRTSLEGMLADMQAAERVRGRLQSMESLLAEQNAELDGLAIATADQVRLSKSLKELTQSVRQATSEMSETAAGQAEVAAQVAAFSSRLSGQLAEIAHSNRATAGKLEQVEALTELLLSQMP